LGFGLLLRRGGIVQVPYGVHCLYQLCLYIYTGIYIYV
jgi:hypothetical protein